MTKKVSTITMVMFRVFVLALGRRLLDLWLSLFPLLPTPPLVKDTDHVNEIFT